MDGECVGQAATHPGGRPHAERKAIGLAGSTAHGATLYVTLEPCCHWGKTPPCTDAIIDAGIRRVVCAVQDPDPRVNGGGFEKLRSAGIDVLVGMYREKAEAVMSGFFHRVRFGSPEIVVCTESSSVFPDGADAVLVPAEREAILRTRSGEMRHNFRSHAQSLRWMGDLGLTTVAIPDPNPFWNEEKKLRTDTASHARSEDTARSVRPSA